MAFNKEIEGEEIQLYAATYLYFTGEINLDCDIEIPRFIIETPVADLGFANVMIARGGNPFQWDELDSDYLKLFFGFPLGRAPRPRSILSSNPRQDITVEEIKAFSDYVADNQILLNADKEISTGVYRYALRTKTSRTIQLI